MRTVSSACPRSHGSASEFGRDRVYPSPPESVMHTPAPVPVGVAFGDISPSGTGSCRARSSRPALSMFRRSWPPAQVVPPIYVAPVVPPAFRLLAEPAVQKDIGLTGAQKAAAENGPPGSRSPPWTVLGQVRVRPAGRLPGRGQSRRRPTSWPPADEGAADPAGSDPVPAPGEGVRPAPGVRRWPPATWACGRTRWRTPAT